MLYPLLLESTLHVKVWGGRKLAEIMGKPLPTEEPYGESWEVHDTSTVVNGPHAGHTVGDLLATYGDALVGPGNDAGDGMPLLVKLIDASQWLSVQDHPNDLQAAKLEGQPRGKTEAWVILAADAGAKLVIGVNPGTDRAAMAQAIRENRLEDLLVYAKISAGDVLYIPAGTVHAIGPGTLLYEIQQSSDTTYRLYDWGRMGLDGKPRELHIEKGVQVANVGSLPQVTHPDGEIVVQGDFFTTFRHTLTPNAPVALDTDRRYFHMLTCVDGEVQIRTNGETVNMFKGQSGLVPAAQGAYRLTGTGTVLRSSQERV